MTKMLGNMKLSIFCLLVPFIAIATNGQNVIFNCVNQGQAAITFDDGPHPTLTRELLDLWRSYNLTTTFFVIGPVSWETNVTRYRETITRAYIEGHQIGSHSYSHPNMVDLSAEEIRVELLSTAALIRSITTKNMTVFRPPYGAYNARLVQIAEQEFGYSVVNWNVDTNDWDHPNDADAGFQEWVKAVEGGNHTSYIGLHHDWTDKAVELANRTIQYVRDQGLQIVTVAECIGVPMYR